MQLSLFILVSLGRLVSSLQCQPVSFEIAATAQNALFSAMPDPINETATMEWFANAMASPSNASSGTATVSGTYNISALYCSPPPFVKTRGAVQVLVHGITYNKTYWEGLGHSDYYNWHQYATNLGYHTLAIDRLGSGGSDKPDPFTTVQGPLQIEVLHQLLQSVRSGKLSPVAAFNKVIYVGHSYGSALANWIASLYPQDVDAFVLTGFSSSLQFPSTFTLDFQSASSIYPSRYDSSPLGYLGLSNETVRAGFFYAGAYDPSVSQLDFQGGDAVSVGTFLSTGLAPVVTSYTGPVMVITGELDRDFCSESCTDLLRKTQNLFPKASYQYYIVPYTGHCLALHYSAPLTIAIVQSWLNNNLH